MWRSTAEAGSFRVRGATQRVVRATHLEGLMRRLARLFLIGALITALSVALGIAPAAASTASPTQELQAATTNEEGDDEEGDDDDAGGGQDRVFCAPAGPPEPGQCRLVLFPHYVFDFEAVSGPLGENPTGSFRQRSERPEDILFFHAFEVTCLQVTGNVASFGGRITESPNPAVVGRGFVFTVVDNTSLGLNDLIGGMPLPAPPPPNTPNCGDIHPPTEQVIGDIVVEDNTPGTGGDDDGDDDGSDG